ncbi:hypothetical protein TBLA_0A00130 [Henningerozyma blattae CBS 6284]|uniref:Uncharacterized protein n=1 Tax=Henningerozyma blattae (strain ATCC 34711 / CBS 6284 / DSM 70876 / NBRC 10599 / NRRL Y-10934 / UCD 77-7) TaxID=1071380 RepID=I2GUL3_HENB6|nr:hypothetical protein TBLA_0A00130 [Tetrapisispora blattae CBS 6284]CCH57815.1 hypothetical protein TBLA_0A00130 [Tetrapisispora blattae CBS 6284]
MDTPSLFQRASDNTGVDDSNSGYFISDKDDPYSTGSWKWAKYILFVLFLLLFFIMITVMFRVNRRRITRGQQPIRGTSWITPPTYRQSERDYHYNSHGDNVIDYVPEYSEQANPQDLGHYDARGEFHLNNKAEYIAPPDLEPLYPANQSTSNRIPIARNDFVMPESSNICNNLIGPVGEDEDGLDLTRPDPARLRESHFPPTSHNSDLTKSANNKNPDHEYELRRYNYYALGAEGTTTIGRSNTPDILDHDNRSLSSDSSSSEVQQENIRFPEKVKM